MFLGSSDLVLCHQLLHSSVSNLFRRTQDDRKGHWQTTGVLVVFNNLDMMNTDEELIDSWDTHTLASLISNKGRYSA